MTIQSNSATPLDFAYIVNAQIKALQEQAGPDYSFEIDRNLQRIAGEHARKGDFASALTVAKELHYEFMIIRTLMDIGCEMLRAGEEAVALNTIDFAWEKSREPEDGFPEENLLPYLDTVMSFGHEKLVLSILKFALARAELADDGNFRLNCYCKMLPYLAVLWREKAEETIDHILSLPSRIPGTRDETLHPENNALIDIAMVISRHHLAWTEERQKNFQRLLGQLESIDAIKQKQSTVRFAEVFYKRSDCEYRSRYIHKYYLPQELRISIFPVDIDAIFGCFYEECDFDLGHGGIPEYVPDCVIRYRDLEIEKHIDCETVRRVLLAIAEYHVDDKAVLTPEENQAAMNLNDWFIKWEKDLLDRCRIVSIDMEQQVRSGDTWLSDYEIDVKTHFYVHDDDPFSSDNMTDACHDDIDSDTGYLCAMKLLVQGPIFHYRGKQHWGIDDGQDHNDRPRGRRSEEIYNVRHCATFHELFSHMHMPLKHAGRIGFVFTDIIVRHQNGIRIDLKGERAATVRDEARIRNEFLVREGSA